MTNIFDNCPDRRDGESVKWNVYEKDVLPMWVAGENHNDPIFNDHRHIPIASLSHEPEDQTDTIIAPSITFNIARMDYAAITLANPKLRSNWNLPAAPSWGVSPSWDRPQRRQPAVMGKPGWMN